MFDLNRVYRQSMRDINADQFSVYLDKQLAVGAAAALTATHAAVPLDKVLIVNSWSVDTAAGATQTLKILYYRAIVSSGQTLDVAAKTADSVTAGSEGHALPVTELILMPGDVPKVVGSFTSGVNSNSVNSYLRGFLIPRGMWSP